MEGQFYLQEDTPLDESECTPTSDTLKYEFVNDIQAMIEYKEKYQAP